MSATRSAAHLDIEADRQLIAARHSRARTGRKTLDLHVIARLAADCAVADLYRDEIFYCTTDHTSDTPSRCGWSDTVCTHPGSPISLIALDHALGARGYIRTSHWRPHITSANVLRYFATATVATSGPA